MEEEEDRPSPSPRTPRTESNRQRLVQILDEALAIATEDLTARSTASNNDDALPVEMTAGHSSNDSADHDAAMEPNEDSPHASKDRGTEP
jgi:hypothetical protein